MKTAVTRKIAALFSVVASTGLLGADSSAADVALKVSPVQTRMGLTVELYTQETTVQGWSFGLCHDAAKTSVIDLTPADEMNFLLFGGPVGFLAYGIAGGSGSAGVFMGVVVGSVDPENPTPPVDVGPFPDGFPLMHVHYEVVEESEVTFCGTLGLPPVSLSVVHEGQSIEPAILQGGTLLEPRYEQELNFHVTPELSDEVVTVRLVSPTAAIQGWSFALCHWDEKARINEIATAMDLGILRAGNPVDYVSTDILPGDPRGGVTQGVVIDFAARSYGPYPQGIDILHVGYEVFSETSISFCDGLLGDPPVNNIIVIRGLSYAPATMTGAVLQPNALYAHFIRGDVSRDERVDLADAIAICLTASGNGLVPCEDAADVNDNGRVDLADAVYLLTYLFAQGNEPASPFPYAGTDLTTWDDLRCER